MTPSSPNSTRSCGRTVHALAGGEPPASAGATVVIVTGEQQGQLSHNTNGTAAEPEASSACEQESERQCSKHDTKCDQMS